jgi:hypothetical protein
VELQPVATCDKALPLQVLMDTNMLPPKSVRIELLLDACKLPYPGEMHLEVLELRDHLDSLELAKAISVVVPYACLTQLQS